jgi:hypothetical protein
MGITSNFNMQALRRYAESRKNEFIEATLEACKLACIKMVERAKQTNTYQDQTHKLRSSIGCVLYHNGAEVFNYFESTGGEMGSDGIQDGLTYAQNVAEQQGNKAIVAVVVAGAEYAMYVESKGYDVLTGSTRQFSSDLKSEFENVKNAFSDHIRETFDL